jgi:hypothetical protein
MRKYLIYLIFLTCSNLFATVQYRDLLIVDKDTFYIKTPLDSADLEFRDKWYKTIPDINCMNSACWRGAVCTWIIENDSIFLTRINSCCDNNDISLSVFEVGNKIFAKWINGTFDYTSGKRICENIFWLPLIDDSYYIYEYDNLLIIKDGKIIKRKAFDNKKTRMGSFDSEESLLEDINKKLDVYSPKGQVIEFDMSFYADELGHISNIEIIGVKDSIIIDDIKTALVDYDKLPVFYRFGKNVKHQFEGHFVMYK